MAALALSAGTAASRPPRRPLAATAVIDGLLRSYAQILIARSRIAGVLLLTATALDLATFAGGLAALCGAALVAHAMALPERSFSEGPYGYNALFAGLAAGHMFGATAGTIAIAAGCGGLCVILTSFFLATVGKTLSLPALTIPFLLTTYLLLLVAPPLGLAPRLEPAVVRAVVPGTETVRWLLAEGLTWVGALVFVPRVEAGLLVLAALLVHSRVAFLLGMMAALLLSPFLRHVALPFGTPAPLLFNGVLVAMALGGTWFVPGPASFVLAAAGAMISALLTVALQRPLGVWGLPLLVLPFNLVLVVVLCAMRQRTRDRHPKAVDFAPGSPERNLRFYRRRIMRALEGAPGGVPLSLPFRGSWICTQGLDGAYTHQGPWRHAFDFEVCGANGGLFDARGREDDLGSYHCYRLPVLAAADGTVVKVGDDVPDNAIGEMDLDRNWGNVVMLWHAPGLYSLVAHLAPQSATVREGQIVRRGDVLGLCGSSGRSPRPHLHFQLQASPVLGAPTIPCAFGSGVLQSASVPRLAIGVVPRMGDVWKNPDPDPDLADALAFPPGTSCLYVVNGRAERLTSEVDLFGQTILRSDLGGVLTLTRTPGHFIVLDVEAPAHSMLHPLRVALGRVPLTADPGICWHDHLPPECGTTRLWQLLRGVLAPFLPAKGAPVEYRCHRERERFIIVGRPLRARRGGQPAALSRALLMNDGWPAIVDVDLGPRARVRAERELPPPVSAVGTLELGAATSRSHGGATTALRPAPLSRVIQLPRRPRAPQSRPGGA